jgi:hypothetical protein
VYLEVDYCMCCGRGDQIYWANITHNLNQMAEEARIYGLLWRPEENGITCAEQLIDPLTQAIQDMKADRQRFEAFNAKNGWGLYENFLPWLEKLLEECMAAPLAHYRASR